MLTQSAERDALRDKAHIHPSEMSKSFWCPRATYYRMSGVEGLEDPQRRFRTQAIFEEGHNIHDKWQTWFWEMGLLFGWWKCKECGHRFEALSPTECASCYSHALKYAEVPLLDEEHLIIGHSDGQVEQSLLEIKSVGTGTVRYIAPKLYYRYSSGEITLDKLWSEIKRPFNEHLRQGMIYLHCTGLKEIIFIYECKWNQQVKEFPVKYVASIVQPLLDGCMDVKRSLRSEVEPRRPDWAKQDHKECKQCVYRDVCYGTSSAKDEAGTDKRLVIRAPKAGGRRVVRSKKA